MALLLFFGAAVVVVAIAVAVAGVAFAQDVFLSSRAVLLSARHPLRPPPPQVEEHKRSSMTYEGGASARVASSLFS